MAPNPSPGFQSLSATFSNTFPSLLHSQFFSPFLSLSLLLVLLSAFFFFFCVALEKKPYSLAFWVFLWIDGLNSFTYKMPTMQPSSVTQEPSSVLDFESKLGAVALDSRFHLLNSDGYASFLSNYLYFDRSGGLVGEKGPKLVASLSWSSRGVSRVRRIFGEFNRAVRFHCEKIPIGFASVHVNSGDNNGLRGDGNGVLEDEGLVLNVVEAEKPKKVLILMSDTGGGHRASAEAIKAAFNEEFGEEYQVSFDGLKHG